jgi:Cu(I)/Ag(I) efflux system membrane fusion protein
VTQPLSPRALRNASIVRWVLIVLSAALAIGAWVNFAGHRGASEVHADVQYRCPMHPQIVSPTKGQCPICGMDLEPIPAAPPKPAAGVTQQYTCPMHPEIVQDGPGNCPICKMKLVPLEVKTPKGPLPEGVVPVTLSLERQQAIGLRYTTVKEADVSGGLRVAASVVSPERGQARVHLRTPGFVEAISVSETGVKVRAGQELARVYSPLVLEAENELLAALAFGESGARQVQAAKEKLGLLGVPDATIEQVVKGKATVRAFPVTAPVSGYVTLKNAVLGAYVSSDVPLYEITDLSKVYVVAEVYAGDATSVGVGTPGSFSLATRADVKVTGAIDLVYPQVNPEARSVKVRMVVPNDKNLLQPGQIGWVEFDRPARKALVVPRDAVIDTGTQRYVFVDEGRGTLAPRLVDVGVDQGGELEVRGALAAGERVVSGAAFLVDSESRLQSSLSTSGSKPHPCDLQVDKLKFPDKWKACAACEAQHAGMGTMLDDCKHAIPQPWK